MSPWVIEAVTSVRVGDGSSVGFVDLPVAREVPTGWPILPGSSVKGALRGHVRWEQRSEESFGSPERRGSVSVHDGILLALPVRSAAGGPALLTSPLALARLARAWDGCPEVPRAQTGVVVGPEVLALAARGGLLGQTATAGLEDLDLVWRPETDTTLPAWRSRLEERIGRDAVARLCLVHDDLFGHAAEAWTEVQHRNAVGAEGIVEDKKLFTVERCPPGTLWWTLATGLAAALGSGRCLRLGGHRGGGAGRVALHALTEESA